MCGPELVRSWSGAGPDLRNVPQNNIKCKVGDKKYQKSKISIHCSNHDQQSDRRASQCAEQPLRFQKYVFILVVVRTWSGVGPELVRTSKLTHFSILATSLTLDLEGVEFNPGNLVCRCYFLADSDTHIDCGSMDFFSADNPKPIACAKMVPFSS